MVGRVSSELSELVLGIEQYDKLYYRDVLTLSLIEYGPTLQMQVLRKEKGKQK